MVPEWTNEQKAAIDIKTPVLVSAAAGSGKTAVLVERVIRLLTDRDNPVFADRLLIVTFTNAAAAEMLSRIEARLYDEYVKNPRDELISRQRYLIKSADICTIDSFCIRLVRENFALCGVEPDFRVTDDNSLFALRYEVLSGIIDEYILAGGDEFNALLELADCKFGEDKLIGLIDGIYTSGLKKPFPKIYFDSLKKPWFSPFDKDHIWYKYAFSIASELIDEAKNRVARMAEAALYCEVSDKATVYSETAASLVSAIEEALRCGEWNCVFETVRSAALGKAPNNCGEEFKGLKSEISSDIEKIREFFCNTEEEIGKDIRKNVPAVKLLFDIVEVYRERLFEKLKEENIFSFDDVEQLALSMLAFADSDGNVRKTDAADDVISRYAGVLVDEFQDVNDLQNTLFEILSDGSENLFIVGDVKQSIYAFRGSNPDIFLNKKEQYSNYLHSADGDRKKVLLLHNYRSRRGICDSVNFFFGKMMTDRVGKLVYDESEELKPESVFPENNTVETDFLVVDKVDDESGDSVIESEAEVICNYVKEVMSAGSILRDSQKEGLRPATYGDFCVLLATLKNKSGIIADALKKKGIPAKVNDGGFFDSTEVVTALSLLHVIDNPQKDIYLLRTLMSPVYGFTAEEMAKIRTNRRKMSLYAALCVYSESDGKAQKFISEISELRRMSCMLPLDKFISYVIDTTDMMNVFYSLPDGDLRAENLMTLMNLAGEYAGDTKGGIFGFLRYIEALPENAVKSSGADSGDCVKIMSIHRSKGLQFPICIVAGLSHKMNKTDSYEACLYSSDIGIGFKYYDREKTDKTEDLAHKILSEENLKRIAQERLRLLYVAMTRAEEKLCLICCLENAQRALLSSANASDMGESQINGRYIKNAQNSARYILAAAIQHPDADILRKTAGRRVKITDTDGRINFRFTDASKTAASDEVCEHKALPDSALSSKIKENIAYSYKFESLADIPAKISVSLLENRAEAEYFAMKDRPAFMEQGGISAAGRGTATHKIMQFIRFDGNTDVESEISRLKSEKRITEAEAAAADRVKIKRFFESKIYKRILMSADVRREMRFLTELPVSRFGAPQTDTDDKFIVQGAVDLCFSEPDGVVVLDFKTDRVESPDELKEKYSGQLGIYAEACNKIFGLPVKEKIIYSFHLSEEIRI